MVDPSFDGWLWGWDQDTIKDMTASVNFDNWFWGDGDATGGLHKAVFRDDPRGVICFDGVCNFCDASEAV